MNVFDILGPVMIGPSSSHTAGAARIGRVTLALLGAPAVRADILLHGSFAKTYRGHGTDKALKTDDERIRFAPELAADSGLQVRISTGEIEGAHPNTARITLTDAAGHQASLQGSSIGGGNILITQVNGMDVLITGQYPTLIVLHRDAPGTIAAVTEVVAETGANICSFRLSRQEKGGDAVMNIELDSLTDHSIKERIQALPNIFSCTVLEPI